MLQFSGIFGRSDGFFRTILHSYSVLHGVRKDRNVPNLFGLGDIWTTIEGFSKNDAEGVQSA
jgi:hypothetical protein